MQILHQTGPSNSPASVIDEDDDVGVGELTDGYIVGEEEGETVTNGWQSEGSEICWDGSIKFNNLSSSTANRQSTHPPTHFPPDEYSFLTVLCWLNIHLVALPLS